MKSPITGKEMSIRKEERAMTFRKEEFPVVYHYYLCEDSGERFTSTKLDEINLTQVYNQYRDKHNLPFPEEIREIREKYGLSAAKMAEVLGFGINSYRNYENGEMPSLSNGNYIQLVKDPKKFRDLVELTEAIDKVSKGRLLRKVDHLIEEEEKNYFSFELEDYLLGPPLPDEYSGYRKPSLARLTEMVVYFSEQLQPWKTKMNKLLFYADFLLFGKTCYSMSGMRYRAIDMGPVPNKYHSIFEYLANNDEVDISAVQFPNDGIGEQFTPHPGRQFNPEVFSPVELQVLEDVSTKFRSTPTKKMVDISHQEKAWIENFKNGKKLISYKYGFDLKQI